MSVMMVAMSLLQLSRAQACAHRIKEVLETEPSVENKPEGEICRAALPGEAADGTDHVLPAPRGEVEFRDVSFKYVASGSGDDVLSHISFPCKAGAVRGHRGRDRHGQIHSGQPDPPVLRCHRRPGAAGRGGCAELPPGGAPGPHRHGAPDQHPLFRHHPGESAVGQPGGHRGGDDPGGQGRPGL